MLLKQPVIDEYMTDQCLAAETRMEMLEKKSRFIGVAFPCHSLADFHRHQEAMADEFPDATHITYAYRIKDNGETRVRCHDAGEPSGTAGKPIFNHIEGQHLINVVIFVIRYFGGIKLGAGGLVRAYGNTARLLLATAPLRPHVETEELEVNVGYGDLHAVQYQLALFQGELLNKNFAAQLTLTCRVPRQAKEAFLSALRHLRLIH